jgi:metallophosphoesterase (TIGR00282 family)
VNILFVGDIVGATGRRALRENLPSIKKKYPLDFILINGENAAGGKGITRAIANEFFEQGVQGITMGNHTWDHKDIFEFIDKEPRLIRPANYPAGTPGQGATLLKSNGKELLLINVMGRSFMPTLDCPFQTLDQLLAKNKTKVIIVDVHAEATSEKLAIGWYLDGKVSAIIGTHTHVQTNDEQLLPNGTAYVTDVGMTGSKEGIIGMERDSVIRKFRTQLPVRFVAAEGKYHFHAVFIQIDEQSGLSKSIELIRIDEDLFKMS